MNFYVISPNVWNDGNINAHIEFMKKNHIVCMGWDVDSRNGNRFAEKIKVGDCIVVAHRIQYEWTIYFAGIVDSPARYGDENSEHYTMCRDIRAIVNVDFMKFQEGMSSYNKKNPGALFKLDEENSVDKDFIENLKPLLLRVDKSLSFSIKEIANWKSNGRVAIPSLQRGLVWNPSQVEFLWDSILRGFPIGAFVFSNVTNISNQRTSNTSIDANYFLLDGQQRSNAISVAFENNDDEIQTRLWVDLLPKTMPASRRFLIKVITKAHPWGYKNDDECSVLNVNDIRCAICDFTKASPDSLKKFDISTLKLKETWPWVAEYPIPLAEIFHLFDFYGDEKDVFEEKILNWFNSSKNISGKKPTPEKIDLFKTEIGKWYDALSNLKKYQVHANILPQQVIDVEDESTQTDAVSNLENLFTRLNTMGTRISPYDLRYSAIKAYWGDIKEENDTIARSIMPGAHLAIFAFRLAFTIASLEASTNNEKIIRMSDVPSISRIRKLGKGENLDKVEERTRSIIIDELYSQGRLRKIINNIEEMLCVFKDENNEKDGLPPFIRTAIVSSSPDIYLFLMILSYYNVSKNFTPKTICAFVTYVHWMSIETKKSVIDQIFAQLYYNGYTTENLALTFNSLIENKQIYPLENLENILNLEDGNLSTLWEQPSHFDFYKRIAYSMELLIFAERKYFNENFKYDPSQIDLIKGHNKPWDYDHIIPKEWTTNKKSGDYRQICKYWTWTIGNYAAIPFSVNRGKSNRAEWDEYLEYQNELLFDPKISEITKEFIHKKEMAFLFCKITSSRLIKIYDKWREFVIQALGVSFEGKEIVEAIESPDSN